MADLDYTAALQRIVDSNNGQSLKPLQQSIKVSKTGANFADNQRLLSIFSEAFPDMDFEVSNDEQGRPGILSKPKLVGATTTGQTIPAGYSSSLAEQGIKDFQTALENAKDDEERFTIASKLNTLVQTQKAYRFNEYKQRAEAEFGIPDMLVAIDRIKQAELASPHNPGTGMPSAERMMLIESLGTARSRSNARINEFMANDPTLSAAEALAKGTLAEIQGKLVLEGRQEVLDERRQKKAARQAAIQSLDPNYLEAVSIIKFNKIAPDLISIAEQLVDNKIKLSDTERLLATADNENLKNFYVATKNPKEKALTLQILKERERRAVGDDKQAERNIELFRTISEKNLSMETDRDIPPEIKRRYKQAQTEVTASAAASGRTKDEMMQERTVALKRELLGEVVKGAFYFDVSQWNGLIQSDETARGIMRQYKIEHPKERMNFTQFVDQYLAYNDGRKLSDKSKAIQAILVSATEAMPRSTVLPIPSAESLLLEAQRITSTRTMKYFNELSRWDRAGLMATQINKSLDSLFNNKGSGQ